MCVFVLLQFGHSAYKFFAEAWKYSKIQNGMSSHPCAFRLSEELTYHCNQIPFFAGQLSLLSNVKRSTNEFDSTITALASNAHNLMKSVLKSLKSTEAVLIKVIYIFCLS